MRLWSKQCQQQTMSTTKKEIEEDVKEGANVGTSPDKMEDKEKLRIELKEGRKDKKAEPYIRSTSYSLPHGYTRRG